MKIVMLCRLYKPHVGGVEKHVHKISNCAIRDGHQVDIFTLKHDESLPASQIEEGIHIHRKPTGLRSHFIRYILDLLPFFPQALARKIVERDEIWGWMLWNLPVFLHANVIHIHDVFFWYWPIKLLLPWKKVFITFHGFEAGALPTKKAKRARQLAAHFTNGNIAVGGWIEKWYGTKADIVTYGAADCVAKLPNSHNKKVLGEKLNCIFVGRLSEDTGVLSYINTVKNTKKFALDIYGQGELLEKIQKLHIPNIYYKGIVQNTCVVFPQHDIACVSSYLSILEAMQTGIPVVAYASDALKRDYLRSHPMADQMSIAENEEELKLIFKNWSVKSGKEKARLAQSWAIKQTWKHLYDEYQELWKTNL